MDGAFMQFCDQHGIVRHQIVRDTPQQNGVAERLKPILLEKAQCMRTNSRLGGEWWEDSIASTSYVVN